MSFIFRMNMKQYQYYRHGRTEWTGSFAILQAHWESCSLPRRLLAKPSPMRLFPYRVLCLVEVPVSILSYTVLALYRTVALNALLPYLIRPGHSMYIVYKRSHLAGGLIVNRRYSVYITPLQSTQQLFTKYACLYSTALSSRMVLIQFGRWHPKPASSVRLQRFTFCMR